MRWTDEALHVLSLDSREKAILASIDTACSPFDIAERTRIPRTSVLYMLKKLISRNLVDVVKIGKRKKFVAISDKKFRGLILNILDQTAPNAEDQKGASLRVSKEAEFAIHVGSGEVIKAFERIASINTNERVRAIQPNKSWMNAHKNLKPAQLIQFNEAIKENRIIVDGILQSNAYTLYKEYFKHDPVTLRAISQSFTDRMADYTAVHEKFFDYNAEIWIYQQTVFIINWRQKFAIEITNPDVMNFMKDMYEIVKQSGNKIDHNQVMKKIMES